MIQQKEIVFLEKNITIQQFQALEVHNLRVEIVEFINKKINNTNDFNLKNGIQLAISMIYCLPESIILKLFKNCSIDGFGGLNSQKAINDLFTGNPDKITLLVLEVLEFNGFFTLGTILSIVKKFPILQPMESAILEMISKLKKQN